MGWGNGGLLFNGYGFSVLQDEESSGDPLPNSVYLLNINELYT